MIKTYLLFFFVIMTALSACGPGLDTDKVKQCSVGVLGTAAVATGASSSPFWTIAVSDLYAQSFRASCGVSVSSLTIFANITGGGTGTLSLALFSNSSNTLKPNSAISSCNITVTGATAGEFSCNLPNSIQLASNEVYWFVITSNIALNWWSAIDVSFQPRISKAGAAPWEDNGTLDALWFKLE